MAGKTSPASALDVRAEADSDPRVIQVRRDGRLVRVGLGRQVNDAIAAPSLFLGIPS